MAKFYITDIDKEVELKLLDDCGHDIAVSAIVEEEEQGLRLRNNVPMLSPKQLAYWEQLLPIMQDNIRFMALLDADERKEALACVNDKAPFEERVKELHAILWGGK